MCLFSGMKYQSNLNEIDKSEQKSQADSSSKVFEWPSKDESHAESKFANYLFLFNLQKWTFNENIELSTHRVPVKYQSNKQKKNPDIMKKNSLCSVEIP